MVSLISLILIAVGTMLFAMLYIISLQPQALSLRIGQRAYRTCGRIRYVAMVFEAVTIVGYVLFVFGSTFNFKLVSSNPTPIRIIGGVFTLVCLSFMTYATIKAGRESAAPDEHTELHKGIYELMRHPQTLGEMLSWFGIAMLLNSLTLLLYSIMWLPLFIGFTVVEDNDLALRFGEAYLNYAKRVGLFWRKRPIE
jgi:protein-S-isoprenylcysteine O-methyltransferase Ste14